MTSLRFRKMYRALAAGMTMMAGSPIAHAAEKPKEAGVRAFVVQLGAACFSAKLHGTSFLMPRARAMVSTDLDDYVVTEVLALEGELVQAGQALARLSHVGPNRPGQDLPLVIVLRAPSGGKIEKSTAMIGAVASLYGQPLFQIATGDEIEMDAQCRDRLCSMARTAPASRWRVDASWRNTE